MADLLSQSTLFGVDPTEGFVQYTKAVKPYHTKILDVLVEYLYHEDISVSMVERWGWSVDLTRNNFDVVQTGGFGVVWDNLDYVIDDFPDVVIKQAVGDAPIELTFFSNPSSPSDISIYYNPDGYTINVNDPITFRTTSTFPNISPSGSLSPGRIYYVTYVNGNIFRVANSIGGTPIEFTTTGTGTIILHQENLKYNSFLVQTPPATQYQCIATNIKANQFTFINSYTITGVNPATRTWTVNGLVASVATPGSILYIHNNTGAGANGKYTIVSSTEVSGHTNIVVTEQVSLLAQVNGTLNVEDDISKVPNWVIGLKVKVTSPGTLPRPMQSDVSYYFVPTPTVGVFNLSRKQLPSSIEDIIDITTFGTGIMNIERGELFYPGVIVQVESSYLSRNNGQYFVRSSEKEGPYYRINTIQKVNRLTPSAKLTDGIMKPLPYAGYDAPNYSISLSAPDLYTDAFIDERITFEFVLNLNDTIKPSLSEDDTGIHDSTEFHPNTSIPSSGYVLLPMGYDTQYFDIGGIDENQHYDNHVLGNVQ